MNELSSSLDNMGLVSSKDPRAGTSDAEHVSAVLQPRWTWLLGDQIKKAQKRGKTNPTLLEINGLKTRRTGKSPAVSFKLVKEEIYSISSRKTRRGEVWRGDARDVSLPPYPGSLSILPANACPAPAAGIKHLVWQCNDTLQQSVMRGSQQSPGSQSSFS